MKLLLQKQRDGMRAAPHFLRTPHPLFTIGRIHSPGKPHAALSRADRPPIEKRIVENWFKLEELRKSLWTADSHFSIVVDLVAEMIGACRSKDGWLVIAPSSRRNAAAPPIATMAHPRGGPECDRNAMLRQQRLRVVLPTSTA